MGLKDLTLHKEYRTSERSVVKDFYLPVLSRTVLYQRAVGFFSSTALMQILQGIRHIVEVGGKIHLIVSPKLSEEDIHAIYDGYKDREDVITSVILRTLDESNDDFDMKRLAILSKLIKSGTLDIKVAFLTQDNKIGMFHEKLGIMFDENGDYIAFSGSLNESLTAYSYNVECIDVYRSWAEKDTERAQLKKEAFSKMWENLEPGINTQDFPKVAIDKLEKIHNDYLARNQQKFDFEVYDDSSNWISDDSNKDVVNSPSIPKSLDVRDYQRSAVENWGFNLNRGIFDMATGTGKTITGLLAMTRLYKKRGRLSVIIVAPYTHLVEQWIKDLNWFGVNPIVGYSDSKYANYIDELRNEIEDFNLGLINFVCFITTNASFRTDKVRRITEKFDSNSLIIVDEAHNFGSERLFVSLPDHFKYRLALSATLDRHNDPEGTQSLYDFFGCKCIEYSLEKAIKEDKLSPYCYYPQLVTMSDDELGKYIQLSIEIGRNIFLRDGKRIVTEKAKRLMLIRSRLVASVVGKVNQLKQDILKYRDDNGILIYCGATNMIDDDIDESEIRQIDLISKQLHETYSFKSSHFTSNEDRETREKIIEMFVDKQLQGIVAIKCLDEGVNIPSIKTAFILASSTNPKEHIQRRGRVLRKSDNKLFAEIYDYVVIPRSLSEASYKAEFEKKYDYGLLKRELCRVYEFGKLSMNRSVADTVINKILSVYPNIKLSDINNTNVEAQNDD